MAVVTGSRLLAACLLPLLFFCLYYRVDRFAFSSTIVESRTAATLEIPAAVQNASRILVVSAFFPLSKSKHSLDDYKWWLSMFLSPVRTHIYFFTSPEMEGIVRNLRGDLPITIDTSFATPFDVPPLRGLQGRYERMHDKDRERQLHSPELYAVWNAKPYLLEHAVKSAQQDGMMYEYAFWNDAGSFRDNQQYKDWPDVGNVEKIWRAGSALTGTEKEDLIFYPMVLSPPAYLRHWSESSGPIDVDFSEGTFFGGTPKAIFWWSRAFYAYHDHYLFEKNLFVGKDQSVFNALFFLFPERFITVWQFDPQAPNYVGILDWPLGPCGSTWFYYQFFFASEKDRNVMRDMWSSNVEWPWTWLTDGRCRTTRALAMEDVLKREFGQDWTAPKTTVDITSSHRPNNNNISMSS